MIQGLKFIMMGAADVGRTAEFYRNRLGLTELQRFGNFVFLDAGGTTMVVTAEIHDGQAEFVFGVESVTNAHEHFKKLGLAFVNEPREVSPGMWAVNFNDPAGHQASFYGAR